jgi:hypothetical protein
MALARYFAMLFYSIVGSLLTVFTYTAAIGGQDWWAWLKAPGVAHVALLVGLLLSIPLSPLMYWSFRNKRVLITLPFLFLCAATGMLTLVFVFGRFAPIVAFLYWLLLLMLVRILAPNRTSS